jgi:hypothetical protein
VLTSFTACGTQDAGPRGMHTAAPRAKRLRQIPLLGSRLSGRTTANRATKSGAPSTSDKAKKQGPEKMPVPVSKLRARD